MYTPGNPQLYTLPCGKGLPIAQMVENLSAIQETEVQSLGQEDLLKKEMAAHSWQPTPVLFPGDFHGQRSLADYSPWGHEESDTTEVT